jgi:hypothetical protein
LLQLFTDHALPNASSDFFDHFEKLIKQIDDEDKEIYLMGDLNCDMLEKEKLSDNMPTKKLNSVYDLYQLSQLTHIDTYYLISEVYDGKFKYYRTPRVFAVEIRKYHQKNPLEKFYEIKQCKIAINYKPGILEQCKLTIPYHTTYTIYSKNVNNASLSHTFRRI